VRPIAIDISNNNPASRLTIESSGAKVLICKATEGANFEDKTLAAARANAKALGIRFGTYIFLHSATKGSEAGEYLKYAKPKKDELVIIDSEPGGQDGEPISSLAHRTDACARALEQKGFRPILYSSSSVWEEMVSAVPALKRLRVWEAQYPGRFTRWFPALARLRQKLGRGASVVMWQFTDSYAVGPYRFDASLVLVPVEKL
jgi:lysozyme